MSPVSSFPTIEPGVTCSWLGAGGECRLLILIASRSEERIVHDRTADHEGHMTGIFERYCSVAFKPDEQKICDGYPISRR